MHAEKIRSRIKWLARCAAAHVHDWGEHRPDIVITFDPDHARRLEVQFMRKKSPFAESFRPRAGRHDQAALPTGIHIDLDENMQVALDNIPGFDGFDNIPALHLIISNLDPVIIVTITAVEE